MLSWGRSDCGQLGHGDFENGGRPKLLEFFEGFKIKRVSAGWNHSAFVTGFCHIKFETSVCYVLLLDIDCFLYISFSRYWAFVYVWRRIVWATWKWRYPVL